MPRKRLARNHAVLLGIVTLALALRLLDFNDPWSWNHGAGFRNAHGAFHTGALANSFYRHGFAESRFMPFFWRIERTDGTVERLTYTHHPALYPVISGVSLILFGHHEWALRLPAVVLSMLSLILLYRLALRIFGARVALLAAAAYATLPLAAHYGSQTCYECAIICLQLLALGTYHRWAGSGQTRALAWCALCIFIAGLFDWQGLFIVPGLLAHAAFFRGRETPERRWRVLLLPAAAVAAVLVHVVHIRIALPSEAAQHDFSLTVRFILDPRGTVLNYLDSQRLMLIQVLTIPGLAWLTIAVAQQLGWLRRRALVESFFGGGVIFVMALTGILNIVLFPGRSRDHEFYYMLSLPYICFSLAIAADGLLGVARRSRAAHAAVALALVLTMGWFVVRDVAFWRYYRGTELRETVDRQPFASILDNPESIVITNHGRGLLLAFYARAELIPQINTSGDLVRVTQRLLGWTRPGRPVWFVHDTTVVRIS